MNEESLFAEAQGMKGATRAAFLDERCKHDVELRRRLEALLAAVDNPDPFLDVSASTRAVPMVGPACEQPGAVIGAYKLLEQIGEGGFGVVFMAEQMQPVRRKVALKVLKPGMDTRQVVARFEAERQALALMEHVHIAHVFDGGQTPTGRPYFVMELVRGVPLTEFCDQNRLPVRDRLGLFVNVCQAVQHAHQKGIIHRDLKPANVMVTMHDAKAVVKVIDFGIAKATGPQLTEKTLFTNFAQMIGTPMYMSPEQAQLSGLDVDTRSDIYSLGVLLYELLTGTTPFDKERLGTATYDEIRRIIREEEPPKPSTRFSTLGPAGATVSANRKSDANRLSQQCRGELDWIVMKALEKDRNRRYETANGFARDVECYLADEPVQACPPSSWYRFRKFARRHKAGMATAVMALCFIVLLGGGAGWMARDQEARRAKLAGQLELILDEMKQYQAEQKWAEALAAAQRAEALVAGGGGDRALEQQVRDVLVDLKLVERLEAIRLERAEELDGDTSYTFAERAYAAAFRDAGVDLDRLNAEESDERLRSRAPIAVALAAALDDWILCRRGLQNTAGAQALSAVAQRIDSDPWRRQVRQAAVHQDVKALEGLAASTDLFRQPPTTLYLLGAVLSRSGQVERGVALLRQAQRQYPGDFWINYNLGWRTRELGPAHLDQALAYGRAAAALRPRSAEVQYQVGATLRHKGDLEDAIACFGRVIELNPKYAKAHSALGHALTKQEKLAEASAAFRAAANLNPKDFQAQMDLGQALVKQGKVDEAGAVLHQALAVNPTSAQAHIQVGCILTRHGKAIEAVPLFRRALTIDPDNAEAYEVLGWALVCQDKMDEAIPELRQAIALSPKFANARTNLGRALEKVGRLEEALASYWGVLEWEPKHIAKQYLFRAVMLQKERDKSVAFFKRAALANPQNALAHYFLGCALWYQDKEDESLGCFKKAVDLDPEEPEFHYSLANNQRWLKQLDEAIASYRTAIGLNPQHAEIRYEFGVALQRKGQLADAIAAWQKAVAIDPNCAGAHRKLTWYLATAADLKLRDPKGAVAHGLKAVAVAPEERIAWSVLGVALWRAGDSKAALETLEKADHMWNGGDHYRRFFLAMAYWQRGDKDKARRAYEQGVRWMDENSPNNEQLRRFRAEAEELFKKESGVRIRSRKETEVTPDP